MIRVNANLFRIAYKCASTEETRYYLNGVHIEKHPTKAGVLLTATDGHKLISIYDAGGHADSPAIIRLTKTALSACKSKTGTFILQVDETNPKATAEIKADDTVIAVSPNCIVDGSFPDYRRVVPRKLQPAFVGFFSPIQIKALAEIGQELHAHEHQGAKGPSGAGALAFFSQVGDEPHQCPAVVRWVGRDYAYGVVMPTRGDEGYDRVPEWADLPVFKPEHPRDYRAVPTRPHDGKPAWHAEFRAGPQGGKLVTVESDYGPIKYETEQAATTAALEAAEKAFA